ncbi:MAG: DUF2283 domain-containing protein [Ardenticatenaceae bacterium]
MQINYDLQADAIYIQLRTGDIDDTLNMGKYIHVDVDKEGKPLGLEILFAKHMLGVAQEELTSIPVNLIRMPELGARSA